AEPVIKEKTTINKKSESKGAISVDELITKKKDTTKKKSKAKGVISVDEKNIILVDRSVTKKTSLITKTFKAEGMMCNNCERIITEQVEKLKGVKIIDIDYATEEVVVRYDDNKINFNQIKKAIESKGYICDEDQGPKNTQGWILGILGILIIGYYGFQILEAVELPQISQNMSYGLLFIVGLLTGLHCVSMCGGFVVSYSTKGLTHL
ncbi:MAG: cation transporter, partial [ANME-2 cluster archaeon]|nr:cation transporter [ANME-2 cluster archaeon]